MSFESYGASHASEAPSQLEANRTEHESTERLQEKMDDDLRAFFKSEDQRYADRLVQVGQHSLMADYYQARQDTAREVAEALTHGDYITGL